MAQPTPHFLRFARALALVSGMAAPMASGCAMQHETDDTGSSPDTGSLSDTGSVSDTGGASDTSVADAGSDAPEPCSVCECVFGGDGPPPPNSCEALGTPECCFAVGPLAPPELPA